MTMTDTAKSHEISTDTEKSHEVSEAFRGTLFAEGILIETGVDGVYGRSGTYQKLVDAINGLVNQQGAALRASVINFPPVMSRSTFDQTGYLRSFPDMVGSISVFRGNDRDHAELVRRLAENKSYAELVEPAEVILCSAACHSVYPLCTGRLSTDERLFDIRANCFRSEPSTDPARMQSFEMHEIVYVGKPDAAHQHQQQGLAWGLQLLRDLGLEMVPEPASDPFFGRLGRVLTAEQLDDGLKIEGTSPVWSESKRTALMSVNYHRDHFGATFGIESPDGSVAHSACVAFGIDRIALALLHAHGLRPDAWPESVRHILWP